MIVKGPPENVGLVYVFHGKHFLPMKEAKEKIAAQYNSVVHGDGGLPVPISRLMCLLKDVNVKILTFLVQ